MVVSEGGREKETVPEQKRKPQSIIITLEEKRIRNFISMQMLESSLESLKEICDIR